MRLILHTFNYMVLTYGYFGLRSWDNDDSSQNEVAILGFFKEVKAIDNSHKMGQC